jgi:hydrogenase/urease accessory protein HupE
MVRSVLLATGLLSLAVARTVLAHDPGLSTATLRLTPNGLNATLTFALGDIASLVPLDENLDGKVTQVEFAQSRLRLVTLARDAIEVRFGGQLAKPNEVDVQLDEQNNFHVQCTFDGKATSQVSMESLLIASLARGHRQFVSVQDAKGQVLVERLLSADDASFVMNVVSSTAPQLPEDAKTSSFLSFLGLGVKHILTGYDHLLFLFALLVVSCNFVSSAKIITCFTLAHSLTLALATLDVAQIPSRVAEPLIAVTIVYVGIENVLRRDDPKGRWVLTFGFGLVHGFGFASVLRELGVASGQTGAVIPLFSFNLGVELGQILIAAMVLPMIWKLRRQSIFLTRLAPACSVLVAFAGAYWFVERVW